MRQRVWRHSRSVRAGLVAVAAVAAGGLAVVGADDANPVQDVRLLSGAAWLASPGVGQATLLDGSSAEVSAQVQVSPAGNVMDVVQQGSNAYSVDQTAGVIRRVDGGTFELSAPEAPVPGATAGLTAIAGPDALYALDAKRGILATADPRTLARRGDLVSLASKLSAGTATVDGTGTLWAINTDNGDLTRLAGTDRSVHSQVAKPGPSQLTIANGNPAVVDPTAGKVITIDAHTGRTTRTLDLDLRTDDTIQISGSPNTNRLYIVIGRGALAICDLDNGHCNKTIPLTAGNQFGPAVEAGNRLFIANYATGQVWIIDPTTTQITAKPTVLTPAGKFQLLTRDGIVFYNNPDNDKAGVIHLDGTITPIAKYDAKDPKKGLTTPNQQPNQKTDQPQPGPNDPKNNDPRNPQQPNPNDPPHNPNDPPHNPNDPPRDPGNPGDPPRNPNDPPPPDLQITMGDTSPTVGQPVTINVKNNNGPPVKSATWSFGDNTPDSNQVETSHQWATAQTYQLSVQATLTDGRTVAKSDTVTVTDKPTVKLTVTNPGGGTITGTSAGKTVINCPGTCTADLAPTTQITLTATEDSTHLQGTWSGHCSGSESTCDLTMDGPKTVGYQFRAVDPRITMTVVVELPAGAIGGHVTFNGNPCTSRCDNIVNRGQNVDLVAATPERNLEFDHWTNGCGNANAETCTQHWETTGTITATFKVKKFTLTVDIFIGSPGSGGKITGPGVNCTQTCTAEFTAGQNITLTAEPNSTSYAHFRSGCTTTGQSPPSCTLTMNDHAKVEVTFELS